MMGIEIAGRDAVEFLTQQISAERRLSPDEPMPSARQVGMVLHALANHTLIQEAMRFALDQESPWPQATSVGRFLHGLGDAFDWQ